MLADSLSSSLSLSLTNAHKHVHTHTHTRTRTPTHLHICSLAHTLSLSHNSMYEVKIGSMQDSKDDNEDREGDDDMRLNDNKRDSNSAEEEDGGLTGS